MVSVPKIVPNGKFSQMYVQSNLVVETQYDSSQECSDVSNNTEGLNIDTRLNLLAGRMMLRCDSTEFNN